MLKLKCNLFCTVVLLLCCAVSGAAQEPSKVTPESSFITVNGASLKARRESAVSAARARTSPERFWTAYSFDVRHGFAYDAEGAVKQKAGGTYTGRVAPGSAQETGHLALFTLHEPDGASVVRVGLQNLDRKNDYGGLTVYWLGRAETEESLEYLQGLLETGTANRVSESAVQAVAMHEGPLAARVLRSLIRSSTAPNVRQKAVQWLAMTGEGQPFFMELVRNDYEETEVRKQAVFAVGVWGSGAPTLGELASVYDEIKNREVKERILLVAHMQQDDDALRFLAHAAGSDADPVTRKRALLYVSQVPGPKAFEHLREAFDRAAADPDTRRATLMSISQRPRDEAVPFLIELARTHADKDVRAQARFWLQRIDDERAREFLKQSATPDAR